MTLPSHSVPIDLPGVTLVAVTSLAVSATVAAMRRSQAQIRFGKSLLLSDQRPDIIPSDNIEWREIAPLRSRAAYSRFMLEELGRHIETGHALCVQWDGFVLDGGRWDDAFLGYDYIGAPWPHFRSGPIIGNGGFSLRSKRLLDACATIGHDGMMPEDVAICRHARPLLEERDGIRFAPLAVARRFSYERCRADGKEFGFHGVFNMPAILGAQNFRAVIGALEREVIGLREARDIRRWAIRNLDLGTMRKMSRKIRYLHNQKSGRAYAWPLPTTAIETVVDACEARGSAGLVDREHES